MEKLQRKDITYLSTFPSRNELQMNFYEGRQSGLPYSEIPSETELLHLRTDKTHTPSKIIDHREAILARLGSEFVWVATSHLFSVEGYDKLVLHVAHLDSLHTRASILNSKFFFDTENWRVKSVLLSWGSFKGVSVQDGGLHYEWPFDLGSSHLKITKRGVFSRQNWNLHD